MNSSDTKSSLPAISNNIIIDNSLLPMPGIPTDDGFVISTNNVQQLYNSSDDLAGIDVASKQFDLAKFNKAYDKNKAITDNKQKVIDNNKLNDLSREQTTHVNFYDMSLYQIIINIKNTWFYLLDDLLDQKFEINIFTKENRLLYIGITIVFFTIVMYLFVIIMIDD